MNPDVPEQSPGRVNCQVLRCGTKNCDGQVSGNSEQEVMPRIEQHGREEHVLRIDDEPASRFAMPFTGKRHRVGPINFFSLV
jgi:predicted small metal-binding protein